MKLSMILTSIFSVTLLLAMVRSNIEFNERQAIAQPNALTNANNTNSSAFSENMSAVPATTIPGQRFFYRGIEVPEEPTYLNFSHPGVKEQTINIFPHR
jgi:hypothetical protein